MGVAAALKPLANNPPADSPSVLLNDPELKTSDDDQNVQAETSINHSTPDDALQLASYCGETALVRSLLANDADPNTNHKSFGSAAYAAAVGGQTDVIRLLIDHGCSLDNCRGHYGTLFEATKFPGHVDVMTFLKEKLNISSYDLDKGLITTAQEGHEEAVQFFLSENGINVNRHLSNTSRTALEAAAAGGHLGVVRLLIARDDVRPVFGSVEEPDFNRRHYLDSELATELGNGGRYSDWEFDDSEFGSEDEDSNMGIDSEVLNSMFGPNWDPRWPCSLSLAASNGHTEILRLLLEHHDIGLLNDERYLPPLLHLAVEKGHVETARYLLQRDDVNLNEVDTLKGTPIGCAISGGHLPVVQLLLSNPDTDVEGRGGFLSALQIAVRQYDLAIVQFLLTRPDVDLNCREAGSISPLHWSIMWDDSGSNQVLDALLTHPLTDQNIKDRDGATPLWQAVDRYKALEEAPKIKGGRKELDPDGICGGPSSK